MKIIIATDKFKGSLDSFEACNAITRGIQKINSSHRLVSFPMADGGDGFARVMQFYFNTETVHCSTSDPLGRKIIASYQWDSRTRTAIVEVASASGLVLLKAEERNPMLTSTYGTGLLVRHAIELGAQHIILGLGGSATNDAGMGLLKALGFDFLDKSGEKLTPCGYNLSHVEKIDLPANIPVVKWDIATDVQNILFGPAGAAHVYAPQKGANEIQVKELDEGLRNFAAVLKRQTGKDIAVTSGAGAAGGIAAGLLAFFDATMKKGIELVMAASEIERSMEDADLLITGEGKIDHQTAEGKVVGGITGLANQYKIPCIAFCGVLDLDEKRVKELGLERAFPILDGSVSADDAMKNAAGLLEQRAAMAIELLMKEK